MKNSKKLADQFARLSDRLTRIEDVLRAGLTVTFDEPEPLRPIGPRLLAIGSVVLAAAIVPAAVGGGLLALGLSAARWPKRPSAGFLCGARWWLIAAGAVFGLAVTALFSVALTGTATPGTKAISLALISLGAVGALSVLVLAFAGLIDVGFEQVESAAVREGSAK